MKKIIAAIVFIVFIAAAVQTHADNEFIQGSPAADDLVATCRGEIDTWINDYLNSKNQMSKPRYEMAQGTINTAIIGVFGSNDIASLQNSISYYSSETSNTRAMYLCLFNRRIVQIQNKMYDRAVTSAAAAPKAPQNQSSTDDDLESRQRRNRALANAKDYERQLLAARNARAKQNKDLETATEMNNAQSVADAGRNARQSLEINQKRNDEYRQYKRKHHHEASEASHCLSLRRDKAWGGFLNSCPFDVEYVFCAYKPKKDSWAAEFDCEKNQIGMDLLEGGKDAAQHTNGAERVYWAACKSGGNLADTEFTRGAGIAFRCTGYDN